MYTYGLPHCRWILYQLSHQGSPWNIWNITQSNGISLIHKKGMREYTHTHTHTHTTPPHIFHIHSLSVDTGYFHVLPVVINVASSLLRYSWLENPMDKKNLVGYSPWGLRELDTSEQASIQIY